MTTALNTFQDLFIITCIWTPLTFLMTPLSRDGNSVDHCEEFPINLLHEFPERSGHQTTRVLVAVMEYGPDFSGPGKDIFRYDRATGEPSEAHQSNFLHPVLYYYETLPSGKCTCKGSVLTLTQESSEAVCVSREVELSFLDAGSFFCHKCRCCTCTVQLCCQRQAVVPSAAVEYELIHPYPGKTSAFYIYIYIA